MNGRNKGLNRRLNGGDGTNGHIMGSHRLLNKRKRVWSYLLAVVVGIFIGAYASNTLTLLLDLERRIVSHCHSPPHGESHAKEGIGGTGEQTRERTKEQTGEQTREQTKEQTKEQTEEDEGFSFPSVDFRIRYYMGDWFNRTLHPGDIPCDAIKPILWNVGPLGKFIKKSTDWKTVAYLRHLHGVLTANETSFAADGDRRAILIMGDSHSKNDQIPAVAKSRFSKFAVPKKNSGKPFFSTIIWPLSMERHYDAVDEYLRLDKLGKITKWEDKKPSLIWRGGVTGIKNDKTLVRGYPDGGWRIHVVKEYFRENATDVDVAFTAGDDTLKWAKKYGPEKFVRSSNTKMEDQLKFKYVLMIEGNDVATGLKWQLASNSVVFMARPTCVTYAMEDLLVPFVHYVPLKDDYSDIVEVVEWARENDDECRQISDRATEFMERLWTSKDAKRDHEVIKRELGEAYHRQFGAAMKLCENEPDKSPPPPKVVHVDPKAAKEVEGAIDAAGLRDTCHRTMSGAYGYEVCLLGGATQWLVNKPVEEGTSLGLWSAPVVDEKGRKKLRWEGGETKYCPGKMPRSSEATVKCGRETSVLSVSEPQTCHYLFVIESPIGCTDEELSKMSNSTRRT